MLDIIDTIAEPEQLQNFPMVVKWCESILKDILMRLNHVISVDIEMDIKINRFLFLIYPIQTYVVLVRDDKIIVIQVFEEKKIQQNKFRLHANFVFSVLVDISDNEKLIIHTIKLIFLNYVFLAGFDLFATYGTMGKRKFLMYDGYRYYKNRQIGENIHWQCSTYKRTLCKGRATTRIIGGYEMMKLNATHSHLPETFHR